LAIAPVIVGLAVGIAFVVLFASMFSAANPMIQRSYYAKVSILGMRDVYQAGEKINFSIRAHGYSQICGAPAITIVNMDDPNKVINPVDLIIDYNCDPTPGFFDITWKLEEIGVTHDITFESGHYKVVARYIETVEKEFDVIPISSGNGSSAPIKCEQSSFCNYQLKLGNKFYPIHFRMNGTIENMTSNTATQTLTIVLNVQSSGNLTIAIPREVVDSRAGSDRKSGADTEFAIFADEVNIAADEYSPEEGNWSNALGITDDPESYRIVVIPIKEGTERVDIVGTWEV
jgi:hypothetical protein